MNTNFTKEQLFADIKKDRLTVSLAKINEATNGNTDSMYIVAQAYRLEKQHYDKAMAWYQLSAVKNNSRAQNSIGHMYEKGLGVPQDYLVALEWFLKSALQNNIHAWINIRRYYQNGYVLPANKEKEYKCNLVIFLKSNTEINANYRLIDQLVSETEDFLNSARKIRDNKSRENADSLTTLNPELGDAAQIKTKKSNDNNQTNSNLVEGTQKDTNVLSITKSQEELNETICLSTPSQKQMYQEKTAKIKDLNKEIQTSQLTIEEKIEESDSSGNFKREIENIKHEIQSLKLASSASLSQKDVKDNQRTKFENVIQSVDMLSDTSKENVAKQVEELEKSYQAIEMLLEQEKTQKADQIKLLMQEIQVLQEEKKQKIDDWEMCQLDDA